MKGSKNVADILCGTPSEGDLGIIERIKAEAKADSELTPRQRRWMKTRRMVERGEFSAGQLDVLCQCYRPDCVVHGTMPDKTPRLRLVTKPQAEQPRDGGTS